MGLFLQYREQNLKAKPIFIKKLVGLGGLEPPTSRLSGVRSNQLSYRPRQAAGLKLIIEEI